MPIGHVKSNTIPDMTGTVTVYDSAGNTQSVAASNLVLPSDWNSNHNIVWNLGGNTAGSSQVTGQDVVLFGGNNITLSANTAASQLIISAASQTVQTVASGNIAGTGYTSTTQAGSTVGLTHNTAGISAAWPPFITTYVAQTTQTQATGNIAGTGYTSTTQAGSTVGVTQNTAGLSAAWPPFITTYVAQTTQTQPAGAIAGTNSAFGGTNISGSVTLNSSGLSLSLSGPSPAASFFASGNTTVGSSGSTISDAMYVSGAGNISVGISSNTVIISATAGGGGNTNNTLYVAGNTTGSSSGTIAQSTFAISAAGALTGGISASSLVLSAPASSSVVGAGNVSIATAGNTISISGYGAGTGTTFAGTNVSGSITLNTAGLNIALSAGAGGGGAATNTFFFAGNTTGTSSGTLPQSSIVFSAAGALTGGYSSSSLILSVPSQTQLTYAGNVSLASAGNTISISGIGMGSGITTTTQAGSTVGLTGATNGLSIAFPPFITTQTVQTQASGNIVGTGTTFAGANLSASMTHNSVGLNLSMSAAAPSASFFAVGNTTVSSSGSTGSDSFFISGAGNISVGVSSNTLIFSQTGGGAASLFATGNTTQNSSGSSDSNAIYFSGGAGISVGVSSNTVILSGLNGGSINQTGPNIAVPGATITSGTVVFSNANGISFGLAGSTVTASNVGGVSAFEPFLLAGTTLTSYGQASVYVQPFSPTDNVVMSNVTMLASINATTSTTSQGVSETLRYGLYSRVNSTSFNLLGSSSIVFVGTQSSTGAAGYTLSNQTSNWTSTSSNSAIYTQITGQKVWQMPFATTLVDGGLYVLAFQISTAAAGASSAHRISRVALNNMTNGSWGVFGNTGLSVSNASNIPPFAIGVLNATSTGLPASYAGSQLSINSNIRHYFVVGT